MPTYRYECSKCKRVFEYFQSMSEPPKKKCPECGGRLERLISGGAGVILKGSGFHNTDYRSKSWHEAAKSEKGESAGAKSDGGKSGEAKAEPKKKDGGGDAKK